MGWPVYRAEECAVGFACKSALSQRNKSAPSCGSWPFDCCCCSYLEVLVFSLGCPFSRPFLGTNDCIDWCNVSKDECNEAQSPESSPHFRSSSLFAVDESALLNTDCFGGFKAADRFEMVCFECLSVKTVKTLSLECQLASAGEFLSSCDCIQRGLEVSFEALELASC